MKLRIFALIVIYALNINLAFAEDSKGYIPEVDDITKEELLNPMKSDVVIGDKNAPVTIIEYASMSCPHCAHFHNTTYDKLKEAYIDTGKAKFIFRDFPLDEPSLRGAMVARCAGEDRFSKFIKVIFSTQSNWAPKKNYLEILSNIGKLGGMKGEEFEACMDNKEIEESIMTGKLQAVKKLDVRSTPIFFVNGEMHKGAQDFDYFSKVIDSLLAESKK